MTRKVEDDKAILAQIHSTSIPIFHINSSYLSHANNLSLHVEKIIDNVLIRLYFSLTFLSLIIFLDKEKEETA